MRFLPVLAAAALFAANDDAKLLKDLKYRGIGPYRGGRVTAVAGSPTQPSTYYFGATGGGVWKTTDSGHTWSPISDGFFKTGSVGALAVAESDPNVIYAGTGEQAIRGNASHGDGVYKSIDAGRTWKHIGLADTRQIGRVRVHPRDAGIVYVCALGHMSGPNAERGVFKSVDGGKTWKQSFTRGDKAGCVDLILDPANPNTMYAGFWQVVRTPYSMESGGPGSGLFKSTDAGETWAEIGRNSGGPAKGAQGKIGVAVSPVNPELVWAIIEAEDGGVFRSNNGGKTWTRVNEQRMLRQRAWYYSRIYADPAKLDTVYVLNVNFHRSDDGGKTYVAIPTPHGDNHDLWIAPNNASRMIEGNDGGANVSDNAGRSWSSIMNQPTAQYYRVTVDNDFPYGIYGAQQDNSTLKVKSRGNRGAITENEWHDVGGGESGWIAPDPKNLNIVYAGSYGGLLTRYDHRSGQIRTVNVWPDNPMGAGAEAMKYRFQWNFPLLFSHHDPNVLYTGGNMVFRSTDEGQSWEAISPDLTRNDKSKQGSSGGPITKDNTGVEYYCTIFTIDESRLAKGLIWTGSDDGLVHVTRDGGRNWSNVTPGKDIMPEWIQINSIEASPHDPAKAYVAATAYKSDDHRPYLYRTTDYGKTWKLIVTGIQGNAFTRVVREDPNRKGLLFAGAETGIYLSLDDGDTWQQFQLNLPVVPITDMVFHKRENDLIVATQGRSFWVFDDLPILHQLTDAIRASDAHLFAPKPAYRYAGPGGRRAATAGGAVGQNPPNGVVVNYLLKNKPQGDAAIEFLDAAGKEIRKFSSKTPETSTAAPRPADDEEAPGAPARVPAAAGLNRFVWDMRYPDSTNFPGMIYWAANSRGPIAVPGAYTVKLTVDGKSSAQPFVIRKDPRMGGSVPDLQKQFDLSIQIRDKVTQANDAVIQIRDVRKQIDDLVTRSAALQDAARVIEAGKKLSKELTEVEQELYQTKNQSGQDPLNYPIKLNNKLAALLGVVQSSDSAPTAQSNQVFEDLATKVNGHLRRLDNLMKTGLTAFNKLVRDAAVPAVIVKAQ
ncbi:MAG: VPS10 domain-containing protein [Bryobacteraceae bacterium]